MLSYTTRLDKAIQKAAWAHERAGQHRKGTDIPYVIHPFGVMLIASNVTDDEDILIACLMHDVLEDVDSTIYDEAQMHTDFGDRVVSIVRDVTKDSTEGDWHKRAAAYLSHLEYKASDAAIIVSTCDKIHNILSILSDYETYGNGLWNRFTTKSGTDQLWWYKSIVQVVTKRRAPKQLLDILSEQVAKLEQIV